MFAAYKYTVRKIVSSKVTWIVCVIGLGLGLGIAGYLPMTLKLTGYQEAERVALRIITAYVLGLAEIMILVIAIFAAFRCGSVFRDELQDGSFLIMLSKPVPRSSLIISKWLGYFTTILGFCLMTSLAHMLGIAIGSGFTTPARTLFVGMLLVWAIGSVFALMFSGIGLFLSTFLSSAKTGAAVLALAFVFPASGLIGRTQLTKEVQRPEGGGRMRTFLAYLKPSSVADASEYETRDEFVDRIVTDGKQAIMAGTPDQKKGLFDFLDQVYALGGLEERFEQATVTPEAFEQSVRSPDSLGRNRLAGFYDTYLYVPSNLHDKYLDVLPLDFDGQSVALATYIVDTFYDEYTRNRLTTSTDGMLGTNLMRAQPDIRIDAAKINRIFDSELVFSRPVFTGAYDQKDWADFWKTSNVDFFEKFGGTAYTVKYVYYHNQNYVLAAYLSIGVGLTLLAILVAKRKNFV